MFGLQIVIEIIYCIAIPKPKRDSIYLQMIFSYFTQMTNDFKNSMT